jgi:hypothetical protein
MQVSKDFDLLKVISNPLISDNYDHLDGQLISKHSGNRRPRLRISFIELHEHNTKFIHVGIDITSAIKRLIIASLFAIILIGLLVIIHLCIFQFPILEELEKEIRLMFYFYPLFGVFALGIYFLSFRMEVSEFEQKFRVAAGMNSKNN